MNRCTWAILVFIALVQFSGCSRGDPYANSYTTKQPKQKDVAGVYLLVDQTITQGGLSILKGQQCILVLLADGSFQATNYPRWTAPGNIKQLTALASVQGRWQCDTVGSVDNGLTMQKCWGINFSGADHEIDGLNLTGQSPPYGLIMGYGDPDSGEVMIFEKKK
jgi:hypothetical protein